MMTQKTTDGGTNTMLSRLAIHSLVLAIALLGVVAGTAGAAPSFSVDLQRDSAAFLIVSRSDERVDYTAVVTNTGATTASAGDVLTCDGNSAGWFNNPTGFGFRWLSNGVEASGPTTTPTTTTSTYVVQAADEGHSLQCEVIGSNVAGSSAAVTLPIAVTLVPTSPAPPAYSGSGDPRPTVTPDLDTSERSCTPSPSWTGSPAWSFQWLRDGAPIAGETASTYTPTAADEFKAIQCAVIGKTGSGGPPTGGSVVAISKINATSNSNVTPWPLGVPPANNQAAPAALPFLISANTTSGTVTLELELPGGAGTFAYKTEGTGWSCDTVAASAVENAKAICTRSDQVAAGKAYPALTVVTRLGADAPDLAVAKATVFGGGSSSPVSDEESFSFGPPIPFGLMAFEASACSEPPKAPAPGICSEVVGSDDDTQAGGHPYAATASFALTRKRRLVNNSAANSAKFAPMGQLRQAIAEVPRGFVGNVLAIPKLCPTVEDAISGNCPSSIVGKVNFVFGDGTGLLGCCQGAKFPIFAIEPEFGVPAQFAFQDGTKIYSLSARVRPGEDGYVLSIESAPAPETDLLEATVTLCGYGPKDTLGNCRAASEKGAYEKPFFTNPTRCSGPPPVTTLRVDRWEDPGNFAEKEFVNAPLEECEQVKFEPTISLTPTSKQADAPTGMDVLLEMPTDGLEDPDGIAQANLKRARVKLPEGMSVNATAGQGLATCTMAEAGFERLSSGKVIPNEAPASCPDGSKIGTVEATTPVLEGTFEGDVYVARQSDNPFGSLLALYMVIDSPKNGVRIKLAGLVSPNEDTGQLEVTFNDNPEVPIGKVELHFPEGPRSPLLNPPSCGHYEIEAKLSPWNAADPENPTAAETVTKISPFDVTQGPGGGPCPDGALKAMLSAGTVDPTAGKTSPFVLRLSREDGTQRISALNVHTPPGLTAYLKGIPYCPEATLASISPVPGAGQGQIDSPSCPAASQIGTAIAGAGAGANPLYVNTGKAYLAGPYKGAPLSVALVAPAVAGPIDLGNVVVRTAIYINPETAEISAVSDPVPTILHGILLGLRDVRVMLDRPHFTLNPTNCEPLSVRVDVKGEKGGTTSLSDRFQARDCDDLDFGPKFFLRLFGGTKRGDNPKLRTVLTTGPNEANIGRAAVTIPRSEFLDQAHIRTICTRVQFAADACPKGSIYGYAKAFTPLLDYPVEGPVYLRSSNNKLPDLVVALQGPAYQPVEAVVVGRIDSIKGQIRATIEGAPDVPVTKFILTQQGGKKGLLINSRDVCASKNRATVRLTAQNGMTHNFRPVVKNSKCNEQRKAKRKQSRQQKRAARD